MWAVGIFSVFVAVTRGGVELSSSPDRPDADLFLRVRERVEIEGRRRDTTGRAASAR